MSLILITKNKIHLNIPQNHSDILVDMINMCFSSLEMEFGCPVVLRDTILYSIFFIESTTSTTMHGTKTFPQLLRCFTLTASYVFRHLRSGSTIRNHFT